MWEGSLKLHILTALTRPKNLERIAASLREAATPDVQVHWHIRLGDPDDPGGQRAKNALLDDIVGNWAWILDDDTTVHPDLLRTLVAVAEPDVDAVVVGQDHDGQQLGGHTTVGMVDTGQVIFRRTLADDHRIPEQYDGDGHFFEQILTGANIVFVDEQLSLYNALR